PVALGGSESPPLPVLRGSKVPPSAATRRLRFFVRGRRLSFSYAEMTLTSMEAFSARSCCVMPSSLRRALISAPNGDFASVLGANLGRLLAEVRGSLRGKWGGETWMDFAARVVNHRRIR